MTVPPPGAPLPRPARTTHAAPPGRRLARWLARPVAERSLAGFLALAMRGPIVVALALFVAATAGYVGIAHYGLLDAAFMTVITLSTVGYEEVHPLDAAGKLFTMAVLVAGFATLVYAGSNLTTLFTTGAAAEHLRQARERRMRHALERHVIVVGFGRVGQAVARAVVDLGCPCLVIDKNPELREQMAAAGIVPLVGDATNETDLVEAGIHRACALVAAANDDAVNLVVTLTARAVRRDLRIVSRVNEAAWRDRIVQAGADLAESPYQSYGMSLAGAAVNPGVLDVHPLPVLGLATEEIAVGAGSPLVGRLLPELAATRPEVLILGLRRAQRFHRWHDVEGAVAPGDVLLALGTPDALRELAAQS